MAEETAGGGDGRAAPGVWAGRVAMPALAVAALALVVAVAGGLALIVPRAPHPAWLATATEIAALVGLLCGNVATGVQFVGAWRVLRGIEEYNLADDAKGQALQAPGLVQDAPNWLRGRLGCQMVLSLCLLVASLLATGVTELPRAWAAASGSGSPVTTLQVGDAGPTATLPPNATAAATPSPTPSPTATPRGVILRPVAPSPTPTPVVVFSVSPASPSFICGPTPQPYAVTLDNTGSKGAVSWSFAAADKLASGAPWATASPSQGTVPAGQTATFTLTPDPGVCRASWTYHAAVTLTSGGGGPYALTYQTTVIG